VLQRFGDVQSFEKAHSVFLKDKEMEQYIIEY